MDKELIAKYSPLVTDYICLANNVAIDDDEGRALLAYRLLTGNDYVNSINTENSAYYTITPDGYILYPDTLEPIATYEDLIDDPVKVALAIASKGPLTAKSESKQIFRSHISKTNLSWIASLFINMHRVFSEAKNVPTIWKLCDYSYSESNHIADTLMHLNNSDMLFAFTTGFITGVVRDNRHITKTFLYTRKAVDSESTKEVLDAYFSEHNLNYILR